MVFNGNGRMPFAAWSPAACRDGRRAMFDAPSWSAFQPDGRKKQGRMGAALFPGPGKWPLIPKIPPAIGRRFLLVSSH
jgi:hypothetical protein